MYALEKLLPSHQQSTSNGELAFFDTLLKCNNGKVSVLVYKNLRVPPYKLQGKCCFLLV